jgi:hypothetical protein
MRALENSAPDISGEIKNLASLTRSKNKLESALKETADMNADGPDNKEALLRQKQRDKTIQKVLGFFSVEGPWRRKGFDTTGRAFKQYFGVRTNHQIEGFKEAESFVKDAVAANGGQLTNEQWRNILFYAEDPDFIDEMRADRLGDREIEMTANVAGALNDYFEKQDKWYKENNIDFDFKERMIAKVEEKLANVRPGTEEAQVLITQRMFLDRMNFIHIPLQMLYDKTIDELTNQKSTPGRKKKAVQRLKLMVEKQRTQVSLRGLWEQAEKRGMKDIWERRLNPASVIINYGNRLAKDKAAISIRDALRADKLLYLDKQRKKKPSGFKHLTAKRHGAMANTYIRNDAFEMYEQLRTIDEQQRWYDKAAAITKMFAFINPLFLSFYDVFQHLMSGTPIVGVIMHPLKTGTNIVRAAHAVVTHSEKMREAMMNNVFSKPYDFPFSDLLHRAERLTKATHNNKALTALHTGFTYLVQGFNQASPVNIPLLERKIWNPLNILMPIYKASWDAAWKLDEIVRMYTYLQLKDQGMTSQKAGETASLFHGDYASVPTKSRRTLNRLFFTPTFKIAMAKLYGNMLKSAWTVPRDFVMPGKKVDPAQARYLLGLLSTASVNYAFDAVMRSLGYEPDDEEGWKIFNFGRKYVKRDKSRLGPKEYTWTWSNPGNLPQRYLQRMARAWTKDDTSMNKVLSVIRWDLHPIANTGMALASNLTPEGEQITMVGDDDTTKWLRRMYFVAGNIIKFSENLEDKGLDIIPDEFKPAIESRGAIVAREYAAKNFGEFQKPIEQRKKAMKVIQQKIQEKTKQMKELRRKK